MVVARTLAAHTALVEQLSTRQVHRQYLAVVVGALVSGGTANAAIDRHPRDRLRMAVREDGKDAVTHYRLRERFRNHTALECRLETGRTHQIRVHMAHLKHPIIGDPLYGGSFKLPKGASEELIAVLRGFKRQALHAEVLEFAHPVSGEPVRCERPAAGGHAAIAGAAARGCRPARGSRARAPMSAWLDADWPAPPGVRALTTTRHGLGVSRPPFDKFNLGTRCGDDPAAVAENRRQLEAALALPSPPRWLRQVHGIAVVPEPGFDEPEADAAVTAKPGPRAGHPHR